MSTEKFRVESDLLGELKVPADALYGVQTQRAINNYHISCTKMRDYPDYVIAIAYVKLAAVQTNKEYEVQNGDTMEKIVRQFYGSYSGEKVEAIMNLNNMKDANKLSIGQKLLIPVDGTVGSNSAE